MKSKENFKDTWKLIAYSDINYASVKDSHKSVTGYIITVFGVSICCKYRTQKIVTL